MLSGELLYHIAFAALAAVTLISGVMVVHLKDMVHCAVFLAFSFVGVAGLYILMHAEYLGIIQILIYVGAVTVLIIFAIMLVPQAARRMMTQALATKITGFVVALILFAFLSSLLWQYPWDPKPPTLYELPMESLRTFSTQLLSTYLIPFEAASVVLLVALIGAILLAKEERDVS